MKLVIVDRDAMLRTERADPLQPPDDWVPRPGAVDALARLNQAGWSVAMAAHYPGLGQGLFDMAALNASHARLNRALAVAGARVEAVFFCPHAPDEACECRSPQPGLLRQIGERFKLDLSQVHAVGNSLADVQAAVAAGCAAHRVSTDGGASPPPVFAAPAHPVHQDLAAFASALLGTSPSEGTAGPTHSTLS